MKPFPAYPTELRICWIRPPFFGGTDRPYWRGRDREAFDASSWRLCSAGTALSLFPLLEGERTVAVQLRDGDIGLHKLIQEQVKLQAILDEVVLG